ncbi:unnamed protein product [marine sediment metagenome]|uniref:NERD domain-containing protein n=1 Tax=marine sediment metagenome TaxID=412755 RepID=X1BJ61_9ZZZZ
MSKSVKMISYIYGYIICIISVNPTCDILIIFCNNDNITYMGNN